MHCQFKVQTSSEYDNRLTEIDSMIERASTY